MRTRGGLWIAPVVAILVATVTAAGPSPAPDGFRSGYMPAGATWSHDFSEAGTYSYYCEPHTWMQASITVAGEPALEGTTANVSIREYSYTPAAITIAPNTIVVWKNEGSLVHTVTQSASDSPESVNKDVVVFTILGAVAIAGVVGYVVAKRRK